LEMIIFEKFGGGEQLTSESQKFDILDGKGFAMKRIPSEKKEIWRRIRHRYLRRIGLKKSRRLLKTGKRKSNLFLHAGKRKNSHSPSGAEAIRK